MKPVLPASHSHLQRRLRLGLLVNPVAGQGGPLGHKGSDHLQASPGERAGERAQRTLGLLQGYADLLEIVTIGGLMGEQAALRAGFAPTVLYLPEIPSQVKDTVAGARTMVAAGVDLLLFAGGDGTARDLCQVIGQTVPVLGVPAGVKMHSGVFAVNPQGAAAIIELMLKGELVTVETGEVRDLDEQALREGRVSTRHYGELKVPAEARYLQQVKCSGREIEELAAQEIAAEVVENLIPGTTYFLGPGSTTAAIMDALHLPKTLMGFDAVRDGALVQADVGAAAIEALLANGPGRAIITATPAQGHLLGRGNQQLTPAILKVLGRAGLDVVATQAKLRELGGRPLLVDSGDAALDDSLSGWIEVITGYQQRVLYRVATHA
jgi:predicted polyphosphate/ATP-dependent NAD kinase